MHIHAQDGETALICAASQGHAKCALLLLDAGADKNAKDKVRMPVRDCGWARVCFGFCFECDDGV